MAEAVRSQASEAEESLKAAWAAEEDEQQLAWEAANTAYLNEAIQDEVWDGTEWYGIRADGVIIAQHQEDDSTDELEGLFGGLSAGDKDMMDA